MPLLRINGTATGLTLHDGDDPAKLRLHAGSSPDGPAIIMVHGFKYAPGSRDHCPHIKLFGSASQHWPAGLGFGTGRADEGLGIAFGWYARGPLRKVHQRAAQLGEALATLITMLRDEAPDRPVHIVAHSLGSEAALSALQHLPPRAVDRIILLTGASYSHFARDMLATPAGRGVRLLNITSRENDLFDAAFEHLIPPDVPLDTAIGQGIDTPNALSLQLDCAQTLKGLAHLGVQIAAPSRRICHWSAYQRPGVMALYHDFLRTPDDMRLSDLAGVLPADHDPRWSRLRGCIRDITLPLPPKA